MAELARLHGIRVVLSSVMPVNDVANADGNLIVQTERRPPAKILALNEWIKKYAADNGYVYLDCFLATADEKGYLKSEITNDGLHPNVHGYAVMGPLAEKAIALFCLPAATRAETSIRGDCKAQVT
jgi:lysophospholipase L1-like esterase